MKIIIDTNIIFSTLLNTNSIIGDLIFNSHKTFQFYSCKYMLTEIEHHWNKLKRLSKLSEEQLNLARINTVSKIIFINEELIPKETWLVSEKITQDIDIDDTDFVALTKHIKGYLWTGDKELYNGLKTKNFHRVLNTRELLDLRDKKEI